MYCRQWRKEAVLAMKQNQPVKPYFFIPKWARRCWKKFCDEDDP